MVLEKINHPNDIKNLKKEELPLLADEIREFLIRTISESGGHLASNLGVVELTMAMHLVFDLPKDKMIWDVGHQAYTHKLLTGRRENFANLRKFGGMSGFPKRCESSCDSFDTGHSSTSISAGLGYVAARDLQGEDYSVISVIGDGSLTGGMAYEAMNNAARLKSNFIIVLNDNNMSISENVGGMSDYLGKLRTNDAYQELKQGVSDTLKKIPVYGDRVVRRIKKTKSGIKQLFIPGMWFEEMGLTYLGPIDGHDIGRLVRAFKEARKVNGPVLLHILTQKGRGYAPAERHPARFHGAEPFDIATGLPLHKRTKANYTDVFATVMRKMGERQENLVAITAAMPDGTGLKRFKNVFPERFFDVGIAEEHAVTFAAGLAAGGYIPVVAIYSSFLQRAYDQILHDVCIQNLPVVFAIDRAGLVGADGETHQGIFDLSFLSSIPNMHIMAPKNKWELSDMMKYAVAAGCPIAVRYPKGRAYTGLKEFRAPISMGKSEWIYKEGGIALLAVGSMVKTAVTVRDALKEKGLPVSLVNVRFVKPFDKEMVKQAADEHDFVITLEENTANGGFGEGVRAYLEECNYRGKFLSVAIPDCYVEHGSVEQLKKELHMDAESILNRILEQMDGQPK